MKKLIWILFVGLFLSGCATTTKPQKVTPVAAAVKSLDLIDQGHLMEANRLLDEEQPERALALYEELLDKSADLPEEIQPGLLTNSAIACLQQADREKFLFYADRLREVTQAKTHLPRNSQFVLLVADEFKGTTTERDLRLNVNLKQTITSVIYGK